MLIFMIPAGLKPDWFSDVSGCEKDVLVQLSYSAQVVSIHIDCFLPSQFSYKSISRYSYFLIIESIPFLFANNFFSGDLMWHDFCSSLFYIVQFSCTDMNTHEK